VSLPGRTSQLHHSKSQSPLGIQRHAKCRHSGGSQVWSSRLKMERNYGLCIIRHSETPQRRQFDLGRNGVGTLARQGSPATTERRDAGRVLRFRSEEPTDRGEDCVQFGARGLNRAVRPGGIDALNLQIQTGPSFTANDYTNTRFGLLPLPDGYGRRRGISSRH
jgi:hypothetical protein